MSERRGAETVQDTAPAAAQAVLELVGLRRSFHQGAREIRVLDGASAVLRPGQAVALVGPSGAGKSTLLHVAGLLETPDGGRVVLNGRDCTGMDDAGRTRVRRAEMGFVYQFHQLLPEFSAQENVMLPQLIRGAARSAAEARAKELLDGLGLGGRLDHRPAELSGGEQQRTAIARALVGNPRLILADEPTANLDARTGATVVAMLRELCSTLGVTVVASTHDPAVADEASRVVRMKDGRIVDDPGPAGAVPAAPADHASPTPARPAVVPPASPSEE